MNDFVKSLRVENFKQNDQLIAQEIISILSHIKEENDVKQQKEFIENISNGIKEIFENFDTNMGIIEHANYGNGASKYEAIIEKYLIKEIKTRQDDIFKAVANNLDLNEELVLEKTELQVDDRIKKITNMLKRYNQNIKALREYKASKNKSNKEIILEQDDT